MLNLENVKGISIPTYSENELQELLSKEDLREFLDILGYEETPGTVVISDGEVYHTTNSTHSLNENFIFDFKNDYPQQFRIEAVAA